MKARRQNTPKNSIGSKDFFQHEKALSSCASEAKGGYGSPYPYSNNAKFDAFRVVPNANKNRPVNMSVRYLVRAAR
jgi:hypothetical protein